LEILLEEHRLLTGERFLDQPPPPPLGQARSEGQMLGAYRLRAPIGEGGMATVWLAERSDGRFERQAALKFLNIGLAGGGAEERFKREGSILGRLAHPHIAQLMDAGVTAEGQPYLVLEYVDGEPIDRYCDGSRLDIEGRIRLFLDVLDAVAHAHANLIVHRDIKPSNVLVGDDRQVKLLDFGIAKLIHDEVRPDAATQLTREAGGAMTLLDAAPEQVKGGAITTATDVYSLGVLLCVLLTGQHPAGPEPYSPAALIKSIAEIEAPAISDLVTAASSDYNAAAARAFVRGTAPDKLRRLLRGDLDAIVAKALKKEAAERYIGVAALSADLRRYLSHRPIEARPDTLSYRAVKFVRRNRIAVILASLAFAAALTGVVTTMTQARAANRERVLAQRRFTDVRQLANRIFDIDRQVRFLPGSSKTRQLIVDTSLEYLGRLAPDAQADPDLALELGTAYMRVGRVQGLPIATNLGQADNAEKNLRIAERLVASVLRARPANRLAMLGAAQIAHDRMVLAEGRRPDTDALPLARQSEAWLQKYLSTGKIDEAEKDRVVIAGMNIANWYAHEDLTGESLRLLRRTIEIAMATNQLHQAGAAQIVVARTLQKAGDLDGALAAGRDAVQILEPTQSPVSRIYGLALFKVGAVLGHPKGISMGRFQEAVKYFQRSYAIGMIQVRQDPNDSASRVGLASRGRALAGVLRRSDPGEALGIYDEVLRRLAETPNGSSVGPHEVSALTESTHALRQIGRSGEARKRLDAAFSRLKEMKLYPSERVEPGSEVSDALCALAELEAGNGNLRRGIKIYRELTRKLTASATPEASLSDATELSDVYRALANLHRRVGEGDAAYTLEASRLDLWRRWERKLPGNPFIVRQLTDAASSVRTL
jgi:serine/threonine-protein kinase